MSPEETDITQRHRKELKELQVKAASMKKGVPVSDKKRRKDILAEIDKLEKELQERQKQELQAAQAANLPDTSEISISDEIVPNTEKSEQEIGDVVVEPLEPNGNDVEDDDAEEVESGGKKMTRAQRRRLNKQAKLNAGRVHEIKDDSKPAALSARTVEKIKLKKILDDNGYRILDMPSDGNCLFSSLCHQLMLNGIQETVPGLRSQTSGFMRNHVDDFKPFLVHHETGDPFTDEDFNNYCHELAETNAWGSQIELRAISNILRWPIRVLQAEGPEVLIGKEYDSPDRDSLTVVYLRHELCLGEHYNSVIPK